VVLGGKAKIVTSVSGRRWQPAYPDRIGGAASGFDRVSRRISSKAAPTCFLMPSRFEPCGLNQMYSQRYGDGPPSWRAVGGLADTVRDPTHDDCQTGATGVVFRGVPRRRASAGARSRAL